MKINEESAHVFTLPGKRYKRSNALKTSVQIDSVSQISFMAYQCYFAAIDYFFIKETIFQ